MYLRRVKLDKMRELMNNPTQKTPSRKAPEPPPSSAANYTPPPFAAPYPPLPGVIGAPPTNNWDSNPGSSNNLPYPLRPNMAR